MLVARCVKNSMASLCMTLTSRDWLSDAAWEIRLDFDEAVPTQAMTRKHSVVKSGRVRL